MRYEFGKNWSEFAHRHVTVERIETARRCLLNFLKLGDLRGKTFLDIGCGSGIHSLAAYRAGASRVIGFDYDPDSVQTSRMVREQAGSPDNWEILQGSVLDKSFLDKLERADIVYSWGVLHHTGSMWEAVANASTLMKPDAVFCIALYTTDIFIDPTPEFWLSLKQRYNRAGALTRRFMEWRYALRATIIPELRAGRNPFSHIREYGRSRGMSYWTDVKDWLGGWPMEFAGIAETKAFCSDQLGLELLNITAGEANSEYLFRKKGAANYWDGIAGRRTEMTLDAPFVHRGGHAWVAHVPQFLSDADTVEAPRRSLLMLCENGLPLGFAHAPHAQIEAYGGSRYSHWGDSLIFSTTDRSDPNSNGRRYSVYLDARSGSES
jgi:SAM-dependent methyltransferase